MTGNQLYNLTWGEYGTSLVSAVQVLRCHGDLVDITLAAGGKSFSAHKVVLCAASPFLLDLLKNTTCKHPIVMLAGVQASDLEALLEFVYRGEVNIEQNQLPSLLQAAHCLNIQGLAPLNSEQFPKQTPVKTNLEIPKALSVEHNQSQTEVSCQQQEEEISPKRKKVVKSFTRNPPPIPQMTKWPKVYVQLDNVIGPSGHQERSNDPQEVSQQNWTAHHMNLVTVTSTTTEPIQTPILIQNSPQTQSSPSTCPKVRGASDQPGTCPLCGAMLRQARNLRRHLLTSCKYRMVGNTQIHATVDQSRTEESQLHNLQQISVQNLNRLNPSTGEHLETPVTCSELLTPSSNIIINMTANNLT